MIKKIICIKDYQDRSYTGDTWGVLTGLTDDGITQHYNSTGFITTTGITNTITNGRLYNWYAVSDSRGIAPAGWHVPTVSDWQTLKYYANNESNKLKATGTTYWDAPNDLATDEFGFKALGSGFRQLEGVYVMLKKYTAFWTNESATTFQFYDTDFNINMAGQYNDAGCSVRLIKDNNINDVNNIIIDGDTYHTVVIGNQIWLKENLATTHYQNGEPILNYFTPSIGAYGNYFDSEENVYEVTETIISIPITANLVSIPMLLTQNIDDIGFYTALDTSWVKNTIYYSGETIVYNDNSYICTSGHTSGNYFDEIYWKATPIGETTGYTVTYTGETQINQFRRYGKKDNDYDLYNPLSNTGFTQQITTSNGMIMQLIGERLKENGLDYQNLYDYKFWVSGKTGTTINYSDIDSNFSKISYNTSGLTTENAIDVPSVKLDYLIGVINPPKINIDVFIDRGSNLSFDRHIKLGEIKSLNDLESYGNGYYKIKED